LARTILVECAWASLRYNPWAKGTYERIRGQQKTRKKKAGIALARKIAVIAWAMLRDETDWDASTMIRTTKSFGGSLPLDEETFRSMGPKENSDQRKSRLRREAREAKDVTANCTKQNPSKSAGAAKSESKSQLSPKRPAKRPAKPTTKTSVTQRKTTDTKPKPSTTKNARPRRARKPVSAS
jgi:hypothetical protein